MSQSTENLRKNIRKLLIDRGMTIKELAERAHMTRTNLSRFLSGAQQTISMDNADLLSHAIETPLAKLIDEPKK